MIVRDHFDHVTIAADLDTAVGVKVVGNDLASVKTRQAPRRIVTGHGDVHAEFDGLCAGNANTRERAEYGGTGTR